MTGSIIVLQVDVFVYMSFSLPVQDFTGPGSGFGVAFTLDDGCGYGPDIIQRRCGNDAKHAAGDGYQIRVDGNAVETGHILVPVDIGDIVGVLGAAQSLAVFDEQIGKILVLRWHQHFQYRQFSGIESADAI